MMTCLSLYRQVSRISSATKSFPQSSTKSGWLCHSTLFLRPYHLCYISILCFIFSYCKNSNVNNFGFVVSAESLSLMTSNSLKKNETLWTNSRTYLKNRKTLGRPINEIIQQTITNMSFNNRIDYPTQKLRRRLIYLPPLPVAPFRGELKSNIHNQGDVNVTNRKEETINSDYEFQDESMNNPQPSTPPVTGWTPEQYPNPWTNPFACGGVVTAELSKKYDQSQNAYTSNTTNTFHTANDRDFIYWSDAPALGNNEQLEVPPQQELFHYPHQQRRQLLLCDPDQVLDKETLMKVAIKLLAFSDEFATSSLIEGGNFGSYGGDYALDPEKKDSQQKKVQSVPQSPARLAFNESKAIPVANFTGSKKLFANSDSSQELHNKINNLDKNTAHVYAPKTKTSRLVEEVYFSNLRRGLSLTEGESVQEPIAVGIALVKKIDLPAILRADSYFFYSDQDDLVNDAAEYFARYIHDNWYRNLMMQEQRISSPTNIVLIFISTEDKICYISSGTRISTILPWWRLEHVVQDMKPDLRRGQTGDALEIAIDDLIELLHNGPPSFVDRVNDFVERFGIVMAFTIFTFAFATWGECRDRRKRIFYVERRSRLTFAEKVKAKQLQREFKTKMCPICLEPFQLTNGETNPVKQRSKEKPLKKKQIISRLDSFGIPLIGTDDKPIKILRCGHIFDETCWKMWVNSGNGNPWLCPVCRQDVGKSKQDSAARHNHTNVGRITEERRMVGNTEDSLREWREVPSFARVPASTPSTLLLPIGHTHPSYNTFHSWARISTPFAPFSHPPLRRFHSLFSSEVVSQSESLREETPLLEEL